MQPSSLPADLSSKFEKRHWQALAFVTLTAGLSWPIMKIGVTALPPLTFRCLTMLLALPCIALVTALQGGSLRLPRPVWKTVAALTITNMLLFHIMLILALPWLTSGRAAILAYTMPIFSAVWGWKYFGDRLTGVQWLGVAAAASAIVLMLWHEMGHLSTVPIASLTVLAGAAIWALGTQQMRRAQLNLPSQTLAFWMLLITTAVIGLLAVCFERSRWHVPSATALAVLLYTGFIVIGLGSAIQFYLVRSLPPIASSTSVMIIPVIGISGGALLLGEPLYWQDYTAVSLIVMSICIVVFSGSGASRKQMLPNRQ